MSNMSDERKYDDIINLPRHVSSKRASMSMIDRAAQFSPFAALTGYDGVIRETGRLTEDCAELAESSKAELNEKLQILADMIDTHPEVTIVHFQSDERKTGGTYISTTGVVKKIDPYEQTIILADRTQISINRIYEIHGEIFRYYE